MMEMAFKEQVQEWKNVLLRGKDPQQLDKYWGAFQKKENEVTAAAKTLQAGVADPEVRELVGKFAEAHVTMGQKLSQRLDAFIVIALVAGVGLALGFVVNHSVTRQLGGEPADATAMARAIASGELATQVA